MNSIAFYNVDFYKDYENVIDFDSADLRAQYFASKAIAGLETENIQVIKPPYEYVKVAGNYNDFQAVNYAIISLDITADGETSSRDYYCFVDKVDYAGDGVVGLAMTLDVWQSALFAPDGTAGFQLQESFVERAHVNYFEREGVTINLDRTYLDVPEDIDVGRDRLYNFISSPGVTFYQENDILKDICFLVVNYTSADIFEAVTGFTGGTPSSVFGGNFGGANPIKTMVIPVAPNNPHVPIYPAFYSDGGYQTKAQAFMSWTQLLGIGENPGALVGKNGIVSIYIERQLPGKWAFNLVTGSDGNQRVICYVPQDVEGQTQYDPVTWSNITYQVIFPRAGATRSAQLSLYTSVVPEIQYIKTRLSTPPSDFSLPWTVEKKAYCYPYCYALLTTDRGYDFPIKPQYLPEVSDDAGKKYVFGTIPIITVYACADFRKMGYCVCGYKSDNVVLHAAGSGNLAVPNFDTMRPEMLDMAVNNNQTDVPLVSDALVEYVQTKKASERAGLVVQGANAAIGAGLALGLGGANPITAAAGAALSVAGNIATVVAHRKDLENTPNTVRSPGNDYGFEYAANSAGLSLFSVSPTLPRLKEIINYFERFGIAIKKSVQINARCRAYWNFVKTIGARVVSPLTSEYTAKLRDIFDAGVRIWHYRAGQTFYGVGVYKDNAGADLWNGEGYE